MSPIDGWMSTIINSASGLFPQWNRHSIPGVRIVRPVSSDSRGILYEQDILALLILRTVSSGIYPCRLRWWRLLQIQLRRRRHRQRLRHQFLLLLHRSGLQRRIRSQQRVSPRSVGKRPLRRPKQQPGMRYVYVFEKRFFFSFKQR